MAQIGKDLGGKVAIVTSASNGIGAASARLFAASAGDRWVRRRGGIMGKAIVAAACAAPVTRRCTCPLEDTARIRQVAAAVREEYGRADILVNSAGFTRMVPHHDLEALDDDLIDQVLTANVRGPFATIRAFVPLLKESGDGVIVNISSGERKPAPAARIMPGASKAALDTMTWRWRGYYRPGDPGCRRHARHGAYRLRAGTYRGDNG